MSGETVFKRMYSELGMREATRLQVFAYLWLMFMLAEGREPSRAEFAAEFDMSESTVSRRLSAWRRCFEAEGWETPGPLFEVVRRRRGVPSPRSVAGLAVG